MARYRTEGFDNPDGRRLHVIWDENDTLCGVSETEGGVEELKTVLLKKEEDEYQRYLTKKQREDEELDQKIADVMKKYAWEGNQWRLIS